MSSPRLSATASASAPARAIGPRPFVELTLSRLRLFLREPGAVFWTFGFPLILTVALGIAFRNRPPEPVAIAATSPDLRARLAADPGLAVHLLDEPSARVALRTGKVGLVVLPGPPLVYLYDPTRPESRLARALADLALHPRGPPATIDRQVTEPGSRYIDFLVPGLIGVNLMTAGMWGIGYVLVEVRVKKLLKRMVATPMSRAQFLFSFVIMRSLFLVVELPVLLGFAWLVFQVGIAGSLPLFVAVALLGGLTFAGIGLLLASRAQNQHTVNGLINLVQFPMFVCSGVFFSNSRFPDFLQPWLKLLPLTALNDALRAISIDGAGFRAIVAPVALLVGYSLASFAAALRIFRWR
jgi:ABC-type multidrug transport system permease subunit